MTGRGYGDKGKRKERVERQPVIYGSKQGWERIRSRDRSPSRDGGRGGWRDRDDHSKKVELPGYFNPATVRPHSYRDRRRSRSRDRSPSRYGGRGGWRYRDDHSRNSDMQVGKGITCLNTFRGKGKTCLNTFRKKKKGRRAVLRAREKLLNKNLDKFQNVMVRCKCGTLNMKFYNTCSKCSAKLIMKQEVSETYLDVERCERDLGSTQLASD